MFAKFLFYSYINGLEDLYYSKRVDKIQLSILSRISITRLSIIMDGRKKLTYPKLRSENVISLRNQFIIFVNVYIFIFFSRPRKKKLCTLMDMYHLFYHITTLLPCDTNRSYNSSNKQMIIVQKAFFFGYKRRQHTQNFHSTSVYQ